MQIIKRDGTRTAFDITKIIRAIGGAYAEIRGCTLPNDVERNILKSFDLMSLTDGEATVEQVQDRIESFLMETGLYDVAKAFILHRAEHAESRFFRERAAFVESYSDPSKNAAGASETDANANVSVKNIANLN